MSIQILLIFCVFLLPIFAFLIIIPGVRQSKFISSFAFLTSMTTGMAIFLCIHYPGWMTFDGKIASNFQANSHKWIDAKFQVNIGLNAINISLWNDGIIEIDSKMNDSNKSNENLFGSLLFNEEIGRNASESIKTIHQFEYQQPQIYNYNEYFPLTTTGIDILPSLKLGMPFPLLKIVEYLDSERTGFTFGHQCAIAGYWACVILWFAFALWLLHILILIFVPSHFGVFTICCGLCMLLSNLIYFLNFPANNSRIKFFTGIHPSICFYTILVIGFLNVLIGFSFWVMKKLGIKLEPFFSLKQDDNELEYFEEFNNKRWTEEGKETEQRPMKRIFMPDWKFNWPIGVLENNANFDDLSLNVCISSVSSFTI